MLIISARPSARLAGGWALHSGVLSPGTMAVLRHTCGDTSHPHNNAAPRDRGMWQIADIMQRDVWRDGDMWRHGYYYGLSLGWQCQC